MQVDGHGNDATIINGGFTILLIDTVSLIFCHSFKPVKFYRIKPNVVGIDPLSKFTVKIVC
jgi:hypothetical protein